MVGVLAVAYDFMLLADPIIKLFGTSDVAFICRITAIILASVAANAVLSAFLEIVRIGSL